MALKAIHDLFGFREGTITELNGDLREIPDNQEVFAHISTDQSLIIEIMEYQDSENDVHAIKTYFEDLADTNGSSVETTSLKIDAMAPADLSLSQCTSCQIISGLQSVAKFQDTARNRVEINMALLRLPSYQADILITFNNPVYINPESSSHDAVSSSSATAWNRDDFMNCVRSLMLINDGIFG